jgi:hypothetical protein
VLRSRSETAGLWLVDAEAKQRGYVSGAIEVGVIFDVKNFDIAPNGRRDNGIPHVL